MHTFQPKVTVAILFFLSSFGPHVPSCLMIDVYLQVWHVPFHESNFMFRCCYIREAWTHSQVTKNGDPKKRFGMVIVSYAILGRRISFFPVL